MEVQQRPKMFGNYLDDCENSKVKKTKGGTLKTFFSSKRRRSFENITNSRQGDANAAIRKKVKVEPEKTKKGNYENENCTVQKERKKVKRPTSKIAVLAKNNSKDTLNLSGLRREIQNVRTELPPGVHKLDNEDGNAVTDSAHWPEMIRYLQRRERSFVLSPTYLKTGGHEVSPGMRAVMTDWIIQVQKHLKLRDETLHMCIMLTDQVLSIHVPRLDQYQLIGTTALLISCKVCERYAPSIDTLLKLTDNSYVYHEIIKMELMILKKMNFNVMMPNVEDFKYRFVRASLLDTTQDLEELTNMCSYLVDISLTDISTVQYPPSQRVAAAICLIRKLRNHDCMTSAVISGPITRSTSMLMHPVWSRSLRYYTAYEESDLAPIMKIFASLLVKVKTARHKGAYKKYGSVSRYRAICDANLLSPTNSLLVAMSSKACS